MAMLTQQERMTDVISRPGFWRGKTCLLLLYPMTAYLDTRDLCTGMDD
jgi:hypothetical protein